MDRSQPASSNLMDTHNRLIANILTHYRALTMLATIQAEGERNNANPQSIAVSGISMKMEFDGLYSSIKELLTLSRKIKELWVFGPLGREDPDQRAKEEQIERDVKRVAELLDGVDAGNMGALAQECGGTWAAMGKGEKAEGKETEAAAAMAPGPAAGEVAK